MNLSIEALKAKNLVEFLSEHYHLTFRCVGGEYVCHSPFTEDRNPSFFVCQVEGHWLFKDFSSGLGGSIFDFVQIKEKLEKFSDVMRHINGLLSCQSDCGLPAGGQLEAGGDKMPEEGDACVAGGKPYDIKGLYDQFKGEDITVCRDYLLQRGISGELVDELIVERIVLHNRYKGQSYCCFALFDGQGELRGLDNHQIDGPGKFVLGAKDIFTRDWESLPKAEQVFICEGIIDYLSVKTLEEGAIPGLALLGNNVSMAPGLLPSIRQIISAVDDDRGGYSAYLDLRDQFPGVEIKVYDLEGYKDPNELLMAVKGGKGGKLSPARKLKLYQEFLRSSNKAELSRKWGLDRSYMYEIARECEQTLLGSFSERKAGRRPEGMPLTLEEARERIKTLEGQYEKEARERELLYCEREFLKLGLKWARIENAELQGLPIDDSGTPEKKKQIKKKKRRKP